MEQKTVFISYRRAISRYLARSIYQDLKTNGWDVFLDVNIIDAGDFDLIILNQIAARAHFILLISKGSLERCVNSDDWVLQEIKESIRLNRNIIPIIEEEASFTEEIAYLPEKVRAIIRKKNALPLHHFYFDAGMDALRTRFLKTPEYVRIQETPTEKCTELQSLIEQTEEFKHPTSLNLMPNPFKWIAISDSSGTLKTDEYGVSTNDYWMAKYPVTNAQYAKFIEAGGYDNHKWWTESGWTLKQGENWTEPRYWHDREWNSSSQPVVGVSWYEAVAFCLWLSNETGEKITLPTEDQWQYAAQGNDGRKYPWGNKWDCTYCNNSVNPCDRNVTTPVTQYEGKGDSPFGIGDMAGNVWEWCLNGYDSISNKVDDNGSARILHGGSFLNATTDSFNNNYRSWYLPLYTNFNAGFRIVRL